MHFRSVWRLRSVNLASCVLLTSFCLLLIVCMTSSVLGVSSLEVRTMSDGSLSVSVHGHLWLSSAPTFFRADNTVYSTSDGSLKQVSPPVPSAGTDHLGNFVADTVTYSARGKLVTVSVRSYTDEHLPLSIFTQTFVDGLTGTSASDENKVISGFPSFEIGNTGLGYLAYNGLFAGWMDQATGVWTANMSHLADGLSSGPLALFDKTGRVLVISTFDKFMAASYEHNTAKATVSWGIMGRVNDIPAGFTYSTVVYCGSQGINKAMKSWGTVLQHWYSRSSTTSHQADISNNYIGYYTDNGAFYYQIPEQGLNFEQTLLAVYNYSIKYSLPYRYLQYDDWFYPTAGPTDYGATVTWDALPTVFPHGLEYLYNFTKLPVVAHNRYWSDKTPYAIQNGGRFKFVFDEAGNALPDDQLFWDWLFSSAKLWGLVTYEQDWLNYQIESISVVQTDLTLGGRWLRQMAEAAKRYALTLQYCMALPRHVLATLETGTVVTQVRASIDYHLKSSQHLIGVSSLFVDSLGLAPFKDNFWTTRSQPGNRYNKTEDNAMLQAVVSLLSTGPVGVSDKIGYTDVELVHSLCTSSGLLLQPSQPATAIDAQLMQAAFGGDIGPKGQVWTTVSVISGFTFGVVFAAELQEPFTLHTYQTGWGHKFPVSYVYSSKYVMGDRWKPAALFDASCPLHLATCNNYTTMCLYYTSPVFTVGSVRMYLAGEMSKLLPMSPRRVISVSVSTLDVTVELIGSPTERVNFDICQLTDTVPTCQTVPCTITDTGTATLSALKRVCQ